MKIIHSNNNISSFRTQNQILRYWNKNNLADMFCQFAKKHYLRIELFEMIENHAK